MHEQPRSAVEIALVEEGVGGLRVAARRREGGDLALPESGGRRRRRCLAAATERGDQDPGLGEAYGTDAKKTLDKLFD